MDQISFRCSTCDHLLKANADRAGRKVKCNRCNALITIPASQDEEEGATAAAAPVKKPDDDDEEGRGDGLGYGLSVDPREEAEKRRREEEARKARKKKKDEPQHIIKKRIKTIYDAKDWGKVRTGLVILLFALGFWGLQLLLHEIVVLIGLIAGPQYNQLIPQALLLPEPEDWPVPGRRAPIDRLGFAMGLVSGSGFRVVGKVFFILGEVFLIVMGGMFVAAYFFLKNVPDRSGSRRQVKGLLILGITNVSLALLLKLLPITTGFGPALIPLIVPEVPMIDANIERLTPLHTFWMHTPFWETILCLLLQLAFYAEPFLIGVFLWTASRILQEEVLEEQCHGLTMLAGGVYFIAFAFLILSLTGTSEVIITMQKVIYLLWLGFLIGYLIRFAVVLNNFRLKVDRLVADSLADEKKTGKKKKTRKLFPTEDDEEQEEEDEDEDEDEEDEDED